MLLASMINPLRHPCQGSGEAVSSWAAVVGKWKNLFFWINDRNCSIVSLLPRGVGSPTRQTKLYWADGAWIAFHLGEGEL